MVVRPSAGRGLRRLALGLGVAVLGTMLLMCAAFMWALLGLPIEGPALGPGKPTLLLEAANGEPLGRIGPLRTAETPLRDFSPLLIKAVLSTEDRRFFSHPGIDLWGILRAAHANRVAGGIVEGGSTITQQLVKLEYLSDDRSYVRKLREALIAVWLETRLSKDQILARYLNRVYLGNDAWGMAAAARLYFAERPNDLTLAQAALLAGLIQAPSQFDPLHHLKAAERRTAQVLDAMVSAGAIDAKAAAAAKSKPATVEPSPALSPARSWFADWAAQQAVQLAGGRAVTLRVRTTLVPQMQHLAQQIVNSTLAEKGRALGVSQAALVAMRPNGAVLAMVGGRNYGKSQFNRAVDAERQPGSAFKLFVYLAALRAGYTPQDTIDAGPIDVDGWRPANFDNEKYGRITLADAFAQSVNTAAVRLAMNVGLDKVVAAARDLGITEPLPQVPSLALGSAGVSLLDLTGAFASVRADRMHLRPWGVAAIGGQSGSRLLATTPSLADAPSLDPYQQPLIQLLRGVVESGTGRTANIDAAAAGKTGTSQDYRDAWFIGFDNALVVGVWVGNDDDSPMKGVVGGSLPAAIWRNFMTAAPPLLAQQGVEATLAPAAAATSAGAVETGIEGSSGQSNPNCDYDACAAAYHSFRSSDCTYQPYGGGPRQLCMKPAAAAAAAATDAGSGSEASAGQCNVAACRQFYSSFNPADCTYQPYGGGPRQLCEK